uniref:Replication protein A C-terminal domain-containing protein n=1 Tax=Neogobius melanostomus TaxID=47308 RepID=A0A8C6THZ1_9GOBI
MWNQVETSRELPGWMKVTKPAEMRKATLQILPCTVSQLLSACPVYNEVFTIRDLELNQVSIVGIVRGASPCATHNQYYVDDMTGPPLSVRQWINTDDSSAQVDPEPGVYVKVHGSLRVFQGKKSLLAKDIRCVTDLNELTSHMLEVVYAHMQVFGKGCDVNMNALPVSDGLQISAEGHAENGLSTVQGQVMHVVSQHSGNDVGISFRDLVTQLDYVGIEDVRKSLAFLLNEGHVFYTVDENHFKSTEH